MNGLVQQARSAEKLDVYLRDIQHYPRITRERERELGYLMRGGTTAEQSIAREELIVANLRLVIWVAKRHCNAQAGIELIDLIQEGNIGLARAAELYNPDAGAAFGTYARWWIRQRILLYVNERSGAVMSVPVRIGRSIHKVVSIRSRLSQELQRHVTTAEVAHAADLRVERVEELLCIARSHVSLDGPPTQDDATRPGASTLIERYASPHPEAELLASIEGQELRAALDILSPREREVLTLHYGLDGHELTLEGIGERLRLTRERVRQIEVEAIRRLRAFLRTRRSSRT